jgi:diaminohydroxyphosphoribosylaminopyrimidine deaminase/5-amino-6-(5-phosphoribosylamino)uracil reductase
MRRALTLAARARGRTSPNPLVGCVIVGDGRVLGEGYHHRAGLPHAEVEALASVRDRRALRGATVYVTLEPCDHVGRTGRCTEALVRARVGRVVAAMRDPSPRVDGRGFRRLRAAGVRVASGLYEDEARALNRAYVKWVTTGTPFVTLKAAVTLDGRLAARGGDARWVSGEASRALAHRMRAEADALLVGAGTVRADDPRLTARVPGGRDPLRVIVDGALTTPPRARALPGALVFTTRAAPGGAGLTRRGAELVRLAGARGRVPLAAVLRELGRRGVTSLLVEGGGDIHGQLVAARLVDEVVLIIAPKLVGAGGVPLLDLPGPTRMADAWRQAGVEVERAGDDLVVRGRLAAAPRGGRSRMRSSR